MWHKNILETIGETPIVRINNLNPNPKVTLLVKLESRNPGGSIKDRLGHALVLDGIKRGKLKKGGTIVEATGAGNTGIGLAITARVLGFKCVLVIPDKVSEEKRNLLRAYGAKIVVAPTRVPAEDPRSYYKVADRLAREIPDAYQPNQYENKANPRIHFETTGPEIWRQTKGKVTHMVIGMGTGGTISGVGRFLKQKNRKIKIIGVDPIGSVFYQYFKTGKYPKSLKTWKVEGIGEDFIPKTIDFSVVDDIICVNDQQAFSTARKLAMTEGILVGGTSGSALFAAQKISKKLKSGLIVVIFPDSGSSYLSKFYNSEWMKINGFTN